MEVQPPVGKKKPGWLYEKKTHETWPLFCLVCLQLLWVHHHHPMKLPRMFFFGFILIIFCYLFSVAGRYQIQISDQTRFWIQETQEQPSESTVCDAKMEGIHFYIFGFMFGSHWFVFETTLL